MEFIKEEYDTLLFEEYLKASIQEQSTNKKISGVFALVQKFNVKDDEIPLYFM